MFDGMGDITPPIFVDDDGLLPFDSIADAETFLEPAHTTESARGFDAEGRLLHIRVEGAVKNVWGGTRQRGARVVITLVEETPTHAEELKALLAAELSRAPSRTPRGADRDLSSRSLRDLVAQGNKELRPMLWQPSPLFVVLFVAFGLGVMALQLLPLWRGR